MKTDKFLLGVLWTVALLLAMDFWLDIRFGFNMFMADHWLFLAKVQTGPDYVNKLFYMSFFVIAVILPFGLYFISRPTRRIRLESGTPYVPSARILPVPDSGPSNALQNIAPVRPPALNVPPHLQITAPPEHISTHADAAPLPEFESDEDATDDIKSMISGAGYVLKKSPRVRSLSSLMWAVGTGETLIVVATGKSRDNTLRALDEFLGRVRTLIKDSLDDSVQIKIIPLVFSPDGTATARIGEIEVFGDASDIGEWFARNPNKPLPDDDVEDFEAYGEYIETVAGYLNDKI
ncbi:MAG: hypothetical protein FWG39_00795 [Alphaproteobacteria bacterium]|nr:hypothetical protein [Alphaproteobacteria bacterium]